MPPPKPTAKALRRRAKRQRYAANCKARRAAAAAAAAPDEKDEVSEVWGEPAPRWKTLPKSVNIVWEKTMFNEEMLKRQPEESMTRLIENANELQ